MRAGLLERRGLDVATTLDDSMATRSILTHQPDVECDVCGRRLLRGERPDAFLDAGQRRIVCELCAPRAIGAGWTRESEALAAAAAAPRGRPGRSLMGRLRQRRQPQRDGGDADDSGVAREDRLGEPQWSGGQPYDIEEEAEPLYGDAYAGADTGAADDMDAVAEQSDRQAQDAGERLQDSPHGVAGGNGSGRAAVGGNGSGHGAVGAAHADAAALQQFNASAAAGRIAGIARSLGEPAVTVRPLDGSGGEKISIVVAWELCWYRYEVDLASELPGVSLAGEGMELDELPGEDRVGNARADERGELSLVS